MPNIHVLNQDTINKIAAGEVIERPMAVVKELLENAIDAGASAVTVEIKDGGKSLIRITDNGMGIAQEDIRLAFTPHATSKIAAAEDILCVSTLGFRGEALSSIASVSQLEMVTRQREELMGNRYLIDGGEEKGLESVGCPEGTTFLVRNLFYNTPARLKFLKTPPTEAGYINSLMERLALSHPDISFRFINQGQPRLHTSGNGNLKDVIYHIYGRDITAGLIELNASEVSCQIQGFIGKPAISRGNRNFMNYFINGRYIKSSTIHKAIEDAYQPYSMQHRYPFTALHFQIDSSLIDINVHPQKMEIRFTDAKGIYQSVYHAISEALKHRELIPDVTLEPEGKQGRKEKTGRGTEVFSQKQPEKEYSPKQSGDGSFQKQSGKDKRESAPRGPEPFERKRTDSLRILEEWKKQDQELDRQEQERGKSDQVMETASYSVDSKDSVEPVKQTANSMESMESINPMDFQSTAQETANQLQKPRQETLFEEGILSEKAQKEIQIIGQVFDTYWILQYEDGMYLIDQHAAHEKVLYERLMKQLREKAVMTQLLQPPVILTLSLQEEQAVQDHEELWKQLGYQIEPFGGREYAVTGVPAHLPTVGEEELLKEVIDTLTESNARTTPEILLDKIASMSCKAAVKGNSRLPMEQMQELLKELMTLENPYHCPHGRPTMIRMSKQELEKTFKRIV